MLPPRIFLEHRHDSRSDSMTALVLQEAQLAFGMLPLLDRASLVLQDGERVGLIGRNGTGKSSLLGVLSGRIPLDEGDLKRRDGLRVISVDQEPQLPAAATLRQSLLLRAADTLAADPSLASVEPWQTEQRLTEFLQRFGLSGDTAPDSASGGERKRAALALAFSLQPDLLLLDEPTNHLDIDGIAQLESVLQRARCTAVVITHDRAFLDRVATRIVELDRGLLRSTDGNYAAYERAKAQQIASEDLANRRFEKFWAQEEVWIRKGVEARRTRSQGRIKRLEQLREARANRRERIGQLRIGLDAGERSGKLVAELTHVGKHFPSGTADSSSGSGAPFKVREVLRDVSMIISRGDRIGFIGPNGCGKSTLLQIILGTLAPDSGQVRLGTGLQIAYFDQMREQLDPERTLAETISPGSEWVEIDGVRKHIMSYLGDFLFPPRRINAPVKLLSGGERNRLLLARLFARPANVLVLDEPTNDLDIESLELLEQALQDYRGTLLLVSHDRTFLDNVVTQTLAYEGEGRWREYVGGYSDWLRQSGGLRSAVAGDGASFNANGNGSASVASAAVQTANPTAAPRGKLSYKETRELAALPGEIAALEEEQGTLTARMSEADFYREDAQTIRNSQQRIETIEALLMEKLERWEMLEALSSGATTAARTHRPDSS
jgi:ATP-binding cassette subfamily F protein uup